MTKHLNSATTFLLYLEGLYFRKHEQREFDAVRIFEYNKKCNKINWPQ